MHGEFLKMLLELADCDGTVPSGDSYVIGALTWVSPVSGGDTVVSGPIRGLELTKDCTSVSRDCCVSSGVSMSTKLGKWL